MRAGLATPMSIMVGVGRGATSGVLIRNAEVLEIMERVNTLVIDKTGTLTEGKPKVAGIAPASGFTESDILRYAASIERGSEHPLAAAIVAAAEARGPGAIAVVWLPFDYRQRGRGFGRWAFDRSWEFEGFGELGFDVRELLGAAEDLRQQGHTVMAIAVDGKVAGLVSVADRVKPDMPSIIDALHREGLRIIMLTGDSRTTAEAVAKKLGIDEIKVEVLPQAKGEVVKQLQKRRLHRRHGRRRDQRRPSPHSGQHRHRDGHGIRCSH